MGGFIMPKWSRQSHLLMSSAESVIVQTDDGGLGLLEACKTRFASPNYEVECDARHTVWVKRADGARSFGLSPWLLRQHPLNEVLERVETKLELTVGER
jgi:hypothetical protein